MWGSSTPQPHWTTSVTHTTRLAGARLKPLIQTSQQDLSPVSSTMDIPPREHDDAPKHSRHHLQITSKENLRAVAKPHQTGVP